MRDCYIPDLTERYPEGLDGVDMYAPRDLEAEAWESFEREFRKAEQEAIDRYNEEGYRIIEQDADGWTFAETKSGEYLLLCTIENGQIIDLYDHSKNNPKNREFMQGLWNEML